MTVSPVGGQPQITTAQAPAKKYIGPGVASFIVPGSGQLIKGDVKKGVRDLGTISALFLALCISTNNDIKKQARDESGAFDKVKCEKILKKEIKLKTGLLSKTISWAGLVYAAYSAYDAFSKKPEKEQQESPTA
jgi:hypothetical protein